MSFIERYTPEDSVIARDLGDETVLLDLSGGTYFGLDEVGALIWLALEKSPTVEEICDHVQLKFEVDRPTVERDVRELLDQLRNKGLINRSLP